MKSVKEIITHMSNTPSYSKLKKFKEAKEFISLLGKSKNSIINNTFCKDEIMYIVVLHPAYKQELNSDSSINQIKNLLKKYCEINKNSTLSNIKKIEIIIKKPKKEEKNIKIKKDYSHLSCGEFENLATSQELQKIYEDIKEELKNAYR